jgi:hypothetical protein
VTTPLFVQLTNTHLTDHPILLVLGGVLAIAALYLLFLRGSVMWGFLFVVLLVVLAFYLAYPDIADRARNR